MFYLCYCTENIATFFMKIHKDDGEICVGVVNRSPNLNHSEFLEIYKTITAQMKSNINIHILGDFNTNLFKHNDPNTKQFEDNFFIEGFYPTVSLQNPDFVKFNITFKAKKQSINFASWKSQNQQNEH